MSDLDKKKGALPALIFIVIGVLVLIFCIANGSKDYHNYSNGIVDSDAVVEAVEEPDYDDSNRPLTKEEIDRLGALLREKINNDKRRTSHAPTPADAHNEGYEEGYAQGRRDAAHGYSHGYGYDDSSSYYDYYETRYQEGYSEGYDDGYSDGESYYDDDEYDEDD